VPVVQTQAQMQPEEDAEDSEPSKKRARVDEDPEPAVKKSASWEPIDVSTIAKVRISDGAELMYFKWCQLEKKQKYTAFQLKNGEWMDMEAYYITTLKNFHPEIAESYEDLQFAELERKYKWAKSVQTRKLPKLSNSA